MLNGIVDSWHVRVEKAAMLSQSTGAGSIFFSRQSEIEQLKETLRQRDEEQRQRDEIQMAQYEAMRQRDDYYTQAFTQ
jgi:3-hydroxy-3-methylglutaryl CoA synthase